MRRRRGEDADAQHELEKAEARLSDVRDQWPAVRDAAATMNRHCHENNFAQKIRTAMGVRGA